MRYGGRNFDNKFPPKGVSDEVVEVVTMGWHPIETAPTDQVVKVGRWEFHMNKDYWRISSGVVWETSLFGIMRRRTQFGKEYSHWTPLQEPPSYTVS